MLVSGVVLMKRTVRAYSPAGVSGFFIPHIRSSPVTSGAQGGGVATSRGVYVDVTVEDSDRTEIVTLLNGEFRDMYVARRVCERILKRVNGNYRVIVNQRIEVPIGGGFGTSGASAIATGLALAKALNSKLSYLEVAREAHIAEIECGTGLGTVSGLVVGGVVLVLEPGPPGLDRVDRIIVDRGLKVILGFFKSIPKSEVLSRIDFGKVWVEGCRVMGMILRNPTLEVFMEACWSFARSIGVTTSRIVRVVEEISRLDVVGVSQAMIGESVFTLVDSDRVEDVASTLKSLGAQVVVSDIAFNPAHVIQG